jgi:hypothetical protein
MKRLLILLLLMSPGTAGAADHYINAAVSGGGDTGADWTNAWATLPAKLTRGDTYWIADGQYGAYTFDDAESDTTSIMIRKATVARHGAETGWDNAYGDGQAEFTHAVSDSLTLWSFTTGNWIIDGGSRTNKTSGHGFKITRINPGNWVAYQSKFGPCRAIFVSNSNTPGTIHNFTFSYIEVQGVKDEFHYDNNGAHFYFERGNDTEGGPENVTIEYCYSHDCDFLHISSGGSENWLVQHNYFHWGYSSSEMHSEMWADYGSDNMVFRYNEVWDAEGTCFLALMGNHGYQTDNWQIYGNVFGNTAEGISTQDGVSDGVIGNSGGDWTSNSVIYNNTFINVFQSNAGSPMFLIGFETSATGNTFRNNLVYQGGLDEATFGIRKHILFRYVHEDSIDYNTYIDAPFRTTYADSNEVHIEKGTGDPFTDLENGDVSLAQNTDPGTDTPYTTDALGVEYDVSGGWTRGAYAFDSGETGVKTWYVDRSLSEDGAGTVDDPWQSSQIAGSLEAGDTLYDITPTVTGANPLTIAVDSVTVKYKTGVGATPTKVGGLKPLTMTNLSTSGSDSVLVAANNDDSFLAEGHAYGWRNYYTSNSIDLLFVGEINSDRRTNIFAAFNFPESITSVTSATLRCFVHYISGLGENVKYDIRGILSKNVTPPSDSLTFQAFYADSLDAATAVSGTLSLAGGDSLNYEIATITDLVNAVLGVEGNTGRVGLMMLTDITGGTNYMRIEAHEEGAGRPMAIYYEYGTASPYYGCELAEGEERNISAVYRAGKLMTRCDLLSEVNEATEYFLSADRDSLYVAVNGDNITADAYGPQLTISGNHVTVYGGVFVHGNQSGAIKVSGDAATIVNCVFDSSSVGIALLSGADTCVVKNNVFAVSDTALADNAAETTEDYNFNITGFDNTGLAGAHDGTLAVWDTRYDAPESWRDLGTPITGFSYYGSAPEPGTSELEALVVDTATFRRGYGVGRWGDALQKRWGGSPW